MTHAPHFMLRGFSDDQILHDGCEECEERGSRFDHGIASLDQSNFARAWKRAAEWNTGPGPGLLDVSDAEAPLLNTLWAIQLQLERRGWPIGLMPARGVRP